jgi:hypothetical protein
MPDYREKLKHIEREKKEVEVSEEDKEILGKYSGKGELELSAEKITVLDMLNKRKTINMITREYNLALKPLRKKLKTEENIKEILKELEGQNLVKSVKGADGQEYWVDLKYFRDKLFGTDKL